MRSGRRSRRRYWTAFAAAAVVLLIAFPDVLLFNASLQNSRIAGVFMPPAPARALIPEAEGRQPRDGYRDLAGTANQLEPAQRFLKRCIETRESPYWNPYSGAGTHGPERLASANFSILTILGAVLGAGTDAFHFVLLTALFVSLASLYRVMTAFLASSPRAGLAACFVFLLTGFHVSMLGASMVQAYVLAPILLYAIISLVTQGGPWRFVGATLASALLLAETFLPTTVLVLVTVHVLALACGAPHWRGIGDALRQLGIQGAASVLGFLVVAPLWFPILESLQLVDLTHYDDKTIRPARIRALLSVATPKHFWESYSAFARTRFFDDQTLFVGRIESTRIYHLGIIALFVAAQAFTGARKRIQPIVWVATGLVIIALGRTFGLPPFVWLEHLPVFGAFNLQYWGAMVCLSFCILVGYGIDSFGPGAIRSWSTWVVFTGFASCFGYLLYHVGWPDGTSIAATHLTVLLGIVTVVLFAFLLAARRPAWTGALSIVLLIGLCSEMIFYMNRLRPERADYDFTSLALPRFLAEELGEQRVLQVGSRGLPPNWGSALGIPQIDTLDASNFSWYYHFFDRRFGASAPFPAIRYQRRLDSGDGLQSFDQGALDLLAVRFVIVSKDMKNYQEFFDGAGFEKVFEDHHAAIYENADAAGRLRSVRTLVSASGIPSDWALDPRRVALTEDLDLLRAARDGGVATGPPEALDKAANLEVDASARIVRDGHARIDVEVDLDQPAVLVLADTWHPAWRATIDDAPVHVGRVDEILRGVVVPAGVHTISLRYRPRSLNLALVLSPLVLVTMIAMAIQKSLRARFNRGHSRSVRE